MSKAWTLLTIGATLAAAYTIAQRPRFPNSHTLAAAPEASTSDGVRFTRLRLATGVELEVAEAGPLDGQPMLFLHGYTDSWFSYSLVLEHLPAGVRAIVPTQRGHGDSERPSCCYRIVDFAADAVALLDALGIQRATVVGHSMGSFVAQRIAIDRPERVAHLVLIASGTTLHTEPVVGFNEVVQALTEPVPADFIREFQESTAFRPLPTAFLAGVVAESGKLPASVWREVMSGILTAEARDELHRIQAPTLVVWGEQDELFARSEQDALVGAICGAQLLAYAETGHSPHWEHPARFVADLQRFLETPAGKP